ncbi:MAG: SDH family Clp fold serine proteinase [Croceibacterium sp.]
MVSGNSSVPQAQLQFPRTADLPSQSAKYWTKEKDRYLRQLLIQDIQATTGRPLFVYFAQLSQQIDHTDPDDIAEIISAIPESEVDLFIQTPGGLVDATEKIVSVLQKKFTDYRVIVPSWAKSAGTVIALSSSKIVFGINSELGPIDPHWQVGNMHVPCELIAADPKFDQHVQQLARLAAERMSQMASDILARGMMKGSDPAVIDNVIKKVSASTGYMSHGAVIDFGEAQSLGLNSEFLAPDSDLWRRIWLLYCMYDYDSRIKNLGKIVEGAKYSIGRPL